MSSISSRVTVPSVSVTPAAPLSPEVASLVKKLDLNSVAKLAGVATDRTHKPTVLDAVKAPNGHLVVTVGAVHFASKFVKDQRIVELDVSGMEQWDPANPWNVVRLADTIELDHDRTFMPVLVAKTEMDDGTFKIIMRAVHFETSAVQDEKTATVDANGKLVA